MLRFVLRGYSDIIPFLQIFWGIVELLDKEHQFHDFLSTLFCVFVTTKNYLDVCASCTTDQWSVIIPNSIFLCECVIDFANTILLTCEFVKMFTKKT